MLRHLRARQRGRSGSGAAADARFPLSPLPQRTGHGAYRRRLRQDEKPDGRPCLHYFNRPGRDEHDHRRGHGYGEPAACSAAARRYFRAPLSRAGAATTRVAVFAGRLGERLLQAGVALLGSHQPSGASHHLAAGGDARADLAGGNRRGDLGNAARRSGRCLRLSCRVVPAPRVDHPAPARRRAHPAQGRGVDQDGAEAAAHCRRRRALQRSE